MDSTFITRVVVQNYKSIKAADVPLGPLTILVGPNGSGKSNFLDCLRFTADALSTTLDQALRNRGGINEVRRRSGGHPNHFSIRIEMRLGLHVQAHFAYKVGAVSDGGFRVTNEECFVVSDELDEPDAYYRVRDGKVETSLDYRMPGAAADRLYLVAASSIDPFRQVFDRLNAMGFYNLNPAEVRSLQQPDAGALLRRDGGNIASVLGRLESQHPDAHKRITEYLQRVAPGVVDVARVSVGPMESLEFRQEVAGQSRSWKFAATNMSDGTLRGLGILVALLQVGDTSPSLIGIEEPEVALHPAAVGTLIDAIRDATEHTQVIVTSHSPDLLDRRDLEEDSIKAVISREGVTTIGPLSESVRSSLRDQLFTPGELLRMSQLEPVVQEDQTGNTQLRIFGRA